VDTRPNLVFDAHNATWTIFDRMSDNVPWLIGPWCGGKPRKSVITRDAYLCSVNHTMAVSEQDRQALLAAARMHNGCQPYLGARTCIRDPHCHGYGQGLA
jgi:hypothetical protein